MKKNNRTKFIFLILFVFLMFVLSGKSIQEYKMNVKGYTIDLKKEYLSEDGYLYYIEADDYIVESKLFEGVWFASFYFKNEHGFLDDLDGLDEYNYKYLNIIDQVYSQNMVGTCYYDENRVPIHRNSKCTGDDEIEAKKLDNAYNQFLDDLGVTEKELIQALKYKKNNPINRWLWK